MRRTRKRHVQLELPRLDKNGQRRGGRRPGAGRKPKGSRAGEAHTARPDVPARFPRHIVLPIDAAVGSLRKRYMYRALREATITVAAHGERNPTEYSTAFRIIHISIQQTHVHLIVEADSKRVLERSMKSFVASAAKHINAEYSTQHELAVRRRGRVFRDRYHQEVIESPRQARNTLAYVLNNWRKHREDRTRLSESWLVDPFSSAASFTGWKERADAMWHWKTRDTYDPLVVYLPRTWLLRVGWRKHGLISLHEVPSRPVLATGRAS